MTEQQADDRYQAVTITLSDGRTGKFFGRVLVSPDDVADATIASTVFSTPAPLPDDCHWGDMKAAQ